MRMTVEQLNEALERDYTAFCDYKNKESVQEVIKISEQLKHNPNLDLGDLMRKYRCNLDMVRLAELQLRHLKASVNVYAPSLIFLITQDVSIFRLLEDLPVSTIQVRFETIEKLAALMSERTPMPSQSSKKCSVEVTEETLRFLEDLFK